jgi:ubiquinone biosynthesis O-methyltransferase
MREDAQVAYNDWHTQVHSSESCGNVPLASWHLDAMKLIPEPRGLEILEVGSGLGTFAMHLASLGARVTGTDFSDTAVQIASDKLTDQKQAGLRFQVADAQDLHFREASFDVVVCCECLEHLPDPLKALREMARVLRPGGTLVLTTENYSNGMLIYWAMAWLCGRPFNSGVHPQPIEQFFLFWRVRRMFKAAGLQVQRMLGAHYVFFALPGLHPHTFVKEQIGNRWLATILFPFARHVSFKAVKPVTKALHAKK